MLIIKVFFVYQIKSDPVIKILFGGISMLVVNMKDCKPHFHKLANQKFTIIVYLSANYFLIVNKKNSSNWKPKIREHIIVKL